jgi:hypothetical protein
MNQFHIPSTLSLRLGAVLIGLSVFAAGCDLGSFSSEEAAGGAAISLAELNGQAQVPATQSPASSEADTEDSSPSADNETPAQNPPPASSGSGFLWQPGADSVRVVIPASLPHWQFHVFSRRKHHVLYGPDNRGGNKEQNVEYILPGSGASWRQKSVDSPDDGTLLVFINTRDQIGTYRSAGWRIMNPERTQSGSGDQLKDGEDR